MVKIIGNNDARKICGWTPEADFSVELTDARDVVSEGFTSAGPTDRDSKLVSTVATIYDNVFVVNSRQPLSEPVALQVTNLTPGVATLINNRAVRVADGIAQIQVQGRAGKRVVSKIVSRVGGATINRIDDFATNSLAKAMYTVVMNGVSGKTPDSATVNLFNGNTRNTNLWLNGVDFTAWASGPGNMTAITPRHVLMANHYRWGGGWWIGSDNSVNFRQVVSFLPVHGDICLGLLDSNLPVTIKPARLLPSTYRSKLPGGKHGVPFLTSDNYRRLWVLFLQTNRVLTQDLTTPPYYFLGPPREMTDVVGSCSWSFYHSSDDYARWPQLQAWDLIDVVGDVAHDQHLSGSMVGTVINGDFVLMSAYTFLGGGTDYADYSAEIAAGIVTVGAFGHAITTVDLSPYTSY